MKKLFAILLAVALTATLSLGAFAADTAGTNKGIGDWNITVGGTFIPGTPVSEGTVCVDIIWTDMNFTYTGASQGEWNATEHEYVNGTPGSWSDKKSGITVKNHSDCDITASFTFDAASGLNVTGTFYTRGEGDSFTALESDAQKFDLTTAVGTVRNDTNNKQDETPSNTIYFCITGGSIEQSHTSLGTITVKIAKYSNNG